VYKDNGLYRFIADKTAGEWDVAKVEPWSIEQEIEEVDDAIRSLIPAQASADNKLADKEYVNDKVSTDTATFRGTFNLITDLELTTEATQGQIATALGTVISGEDKNDYAFVQIPTSDATPTEIARIDRYKYTGLQWAFEYSINNSGFTAEQWAAINSGITSSLVTAFGAKYDKPAGGIPVSDMNTSTFDDEPTAGSDNLVKSGGVNTLVKHSNYEYVKITEEDSGVTQLTDLLGLKAGDTIFVYGDTSRVLRIYYSSDNYVELEKFQSITLEHDLYDINLRGGGVRKVHLLINQHSFTQYNQNPFARNIISSKNLIEENIVFEAEDIQVSSTSTTNIVPSQYIPLIPKGSKIHFEFSDFTSWCNKIRCYLNGNGNAQYQIRNKTFDLVYTEDITKLRLAIAVSDLPSGSTGGVINVKVWWEDIKYQVKKNREDIDELKRSISKQTFIDAYPELYDSVNDKFTAGTMEVSAGVNWTTDLICSYMAKYTSTNDSYPTVQIFYVTVPFNNLSRRFAYKIGEKDSFKYGQCKCICVMKPNLSQSVYSDDYKICITIPEGCELYLHEINCKFSNEFINKDSFKVFNHSNIWGSGFNNEFNWRGWSHVGNYGAVVVPKRTVDGKWVCYHDDDTLGNNGDLQLIGGGELPTEIASKKMIELNFAETQTLEYKSTNYLGDHDRIATLDAFFAQCAQAGVHPMLSIHPGWNTSQWQEIKELAIRYNVLDKLNIKGSYSVAIATIIYNVFENDIESYIPDNTGATISDVESLASIGWDTLKVKVGFEYMNTSTSPNFFSSEVLTALEQNGFITGLYCSQYYNAVYVKDLIDNKLLWEFTSNWFYSNGLSWA